MNCNIYGDKKDVWFSGLPISAALGAGTYFFEVNVPGGQPTPNDGGLENLSDTFDAPWASGSLNGDGSAVPSGDVWTKREFSVDANGNITYTGPHAFNGNKIDVWPYDDTTNPGGVYILSVCKVPSGAGTTTGPGTPGVDPRDCKYDAFKVKPSGGTTPPATDLTVVKDATPAYTRTFGWTIDKSVDACEITQANPNGCSITGPTKTLNYTVTVTKDAGTDSQWGVSGTITIFNPNDAAASSVVVTDAIDALPANAATCTVDSANTVSTGGNVGSLASGASLDLPYSCTFPTKPTYNTDYTNTATVAWDKTSVGTTNSSADFSIAFQFGDPTTVTNNSVTPSDLLTSTVPATLPSGFVVGDPVGNSVSGPITATSSFYYSRTLTVPHDCIQVNNTASFTPITAVSATGVYTDSVSAKVCRTPANTGALTMGFWQNKNGQALIQNTTYSGTACATLIGYLKGFNPFSDLKVGTTTYASTCSGVAAYDVAVFKAATCSGPATSPCNAMLKSQMLATALDVFFSDPGHNGLHATVSLGDLGIDLTNICKMIDGTGGTATCSGAYYNTAAAFGNTPTCQPVSTLLMYASNQSNVGGSTWYSNVKATQVLAKDTFDAINNKVAFSCT